MMLDGVIVCVAVLSLSSSSRGDLADNEVNPAYDYTQWKASLDLSGSDTLPQDDSLLVPEPVGPSISSNLYAVLKARRKYEKSAQDQTMKMPLNTNQKMPLYVYQASNDSESSDETAAREAGFIRPTRTRTSGFVDGDQGHDRFKRCANCGGMGQQQYGSNDNKILMVGSIIGGGSGMGNYGGNTGVIVSQGGDQGGFYIGGGTQTIAGAMRTTLINGYVYTLSSYTQIVNAVPTIGVVTIGPVQTYYQGKLVQGDQNPYGVPNQGTYTLAGAMSTYMSNGYTMTVSSYTRIVDGAATFGAVTLSGMQTMYNGRLLPEGQNPFGVPNQGTFTLPGGMTTSMLNGQMVTMSTYTRVIDGIATYGTVTLGSMQTYYNGKLLLPGDNIYGVPNQGTYTLPGGMATTMVNGYTMTLSTYTRIENGLATFGTITLGVMQTYYNGKLLKEGENAYGVPSVGTYTLQGAMSSMLDENGYAQTVSTYTKIVDGQATFGTVTLGSMQTYYNGRLLQAGENAYGVPNQGIFTLPGQVSQTNINGYAATVSTYTKIVDGTATFGTVTLGGMQTFYQGKLLQVGQNAYGVPNVGVYTIPGEMSVITNTDGYPMTVSTYTKVVDGLATFGTITLASMQTYYNGKVLAPDTNPYGVPNVGLYTLPGPVTTLADSYGYPVTISSYTKVLNGRATFGAVTQGMQITSYQGRVLRYGENAFGVPNQGLFTLPGSMQTLTVGGQLQTVSTYTRISDGVATYGTITISPMQTYFIPNRVIDVDSGSHLIPDFIASGSRSQQTTQGQSSSSIQVIDDGSHLIPDFIASGKNQGQYQNRMVDDGGHLIPDFIASGSRAQTTDIQTGSSSQNLVIDSGSNLIPDFIASGRSSQNQNRQQIDQQIDSGSQLIPNFIASGSSRQNQNQNQNQNLQVDSGSQLIPNFIASGQQANGGQFAAGQWASSQGQMVESAGAASSGQSMSGFSSGSKAAFAQLADQGSSQNIGGQSRFSSGQQSGRSMANWRK